MSGPKLGFLRFVITFTLSFSCLFGASGSARAGSPAQTVSSPENLRPARQNLVVEINGASFMRLAGNTRPEATPANDRGRVSDDMVLRHLTLLLQRTPEQEQDLEQFISDLHDSASPRFHQWITAAEFGQRFGVASADVSRVTEWLAAQGFTVNLVYPNQVLVDFTGTAGQVRRALHTEIHHLSVNGRSHIANMSDPLIPAALASTVAGVVSLHDFWPQASSHPRSGYTISSSYQLLVPADLAKIYNFNPAFAAGYSGQGQTIVLLEDTDLYSANDWSNFRSTLGLATAYPQGSLSQVHPPSSPTNNCTDPGVNGDDGEATLDVEWASAGAPSAAIELASCATSSNWGAWVALQNLLNASSTPPAIVSLSYASPESGYGASGNAYVNSLYQQGVTEGVSIFVAAGDWGADTADFSSSYATSGITVNGLASTPNNVAVGGTDFADYYQGAQPTYWSTSNAANYGSALSYVPEIPWNDSCASALIADFEGYSTTYGSSGFCGSGNYRNTIAGGGGPSACSSGVPDAGDVVGGTCSGYAKPSWQSGLLGNPSDNARDIPDVSLFAANGVWGHYYVVCYSDTNYGGSSCSGAPSSWAGFGGTSVATPIMASIQALANQYSATRWGNPDSTYYALAETEYGAAGSATCASSLGNKAASNCIFYDVVQIPLTHTATPGTGGDSDIPCSGVNCYLPSGTYGVLSTAPQTLTSVGITGLGSGYSSAPSCALSGGGGSGAACSASLTGVVTAISLKADGSGYTSEPTCTLTGGGGTGATCVAYYCTNDTVCYVELTSFGSGYTSAPTCSISGGGGSGATCTVTEGPGITAKLTASGSGYTTMPHCTLSGGGGSGGACAALAENTSNAYQPAYAAGTGWDFSTGIGTVNAWNLVKSFNSNLPVVGFTSNSLKFSSQTLSTTSAQQTVTVTNNGTATLTIGTVTLTGTNPSDFAISSDACSGANLAANGTCVVGVEFTPLAAGSLSASLSFPDNASNSPQTVSLAGTGVPVPSLTKLSPASAAAGGTGFTLTVTGTNFVSASTVLWNGAALTTTYGSSTSLAASVPAGDIATAGSASVTVTNIPPSADVSNALTFTINTSSIAISSISPTSLKLVRGGAAQGVTVNLTRTNYTGSVTLAASNLPSGVTATYTQPGTGNSGSISLTASSSATLVTGQTITIKASGSGVSSVTSTFSLTVNPPSIAISSLSPTSATLYRGGSAQKVTVNLTRTSFTGSVSLAASNLPSGVTATYTQPGTGASGSISLAASGSATLVTNQTITVTASGSGVTSVTSTFSLTVTPPSIAISKVSPTSITLARGGSAQSVTVTLTRTGFTGSVSLSVSTLPSGVTATITQPGTGTSGTVSLKASSSATVVSGRTITITASGSGVTSVTATFSLTT